MTRRVHFVRTLLEHSGPVDLDDYLVGIFILLAVTHGGDALSSNKVLKSKPTDFFTVVGDRPLRVGHWARSASVLSAYVSSTSSSSWSFLLLFRANGIDWVETKTQRSVKLGSSQRQILSFCCRAETTVAQPNDRNTLGIPPSLFTFLWVSDVPSSPSCIPFALTVQPDMDVPMNVPVDDPNADTEW